MSADTLDSSHASDHVHVHQHDPARHGTIAMTPVVLNRSTPKAPAIGTVHANRLCTANRKAAGFVRHVEIDVSNTPLAGTIRPGQSFGIIPPGVDDAGKAHKVRLYSCASPSRGEDGAGNVIATTVKRLIDEDWKSHRLFRGVASNYLCDLQVGESVQVTGPYGKAFVLPEKSTAHAYVFVATGTGIAPFRAMVLDLLQHGTTFPIVLIAGAPYATDLLYHQEFETIAQTNPYFLYITAISRERQTDGHGKMYVDQRVITERDRLVPILRDEMTLVYVCGIAGMEVGLYQRLVEVLTPAELHAYLHTDADTLANAKAWTHEIIARQVKRTHRLHVEVYD